MAEEEAFVAFGAGGGAGGVGGAGGGLVALAFPWLGGQRERQ